ncbi:iron-sulfur cluster assembly protein SufB [Cutibacterium acnes JCM 18918]|nr:iron-sulfur cluster assembly protein SufB [Cutibacterium acnes JCM 18918]
MRGISAMKHEPQWMLDMRLKALKLFQRKPMPTWGVDISTIDFDQIKYFVRAQERQAASWEDLPADIKNTYDRLGIPEAEKDRLVAGVAAQYESEVVYHKINEELGKQGVVFLDTDTALKEEPELFREHFASAVPLGDNKFSALNSAVWSGGTFIYVPKGVHCTIPLQAYFRMNTENLGQFERTLIIVDEGAYVHYVEAALPRSTSRIPCTPRSSRSSLKKERSLPLYDHPELVEQRVQPRHPARLRRRGRHDGVDRRQYRFQSQYEISGLLPHGPPRQG